MSHGADRQSGRRGVPRGHISPECCRPPAGAARGLQVSRRNILEHLLLERQIGDKTLETDVFPLEILHPLRLIKLKPAVFLSPAIVTLLRNPGFSARQGRRFALRHQHFDLTKQHHNLLRGEPLLRHSQNSFPSSFSHKAWPKKAQSGQIASPGISAPACSRWREKLSRE